MPTWGQQKQAVTTTLTYCQLFHSSSVLTCVITPCVLLSLAVHLFVFLAFGSCFLALFSCL